MYINNERSDFMKVENIAVSKLIPYAKNTKKHDDKQIANVAESIRQYGFVQPIVIDKDNTVVIGHCRLLAAKKLKLKEVPCVCVDDLTEQQVKALRIVDNKSNESEWDFDFLPEELAEIDLSEFDFDFDEKQLDNGFDDLLEYRSDGEITEKNYEKPETEKLRCPVCNAVDEKIRFKKVN